MSPSGAIVCEDRGLLRVAGPEARGFLQGLITNDMTAASPDRVLYAALLTPQGKFLFDFIVFERGGGFLLDCDAQALPDLLKRLAMYRLRADVSLEDVTGGHAVLAIIGGAAAGVSGAMRKSRGDAWQADGATVCVDPRLEYLGLRVIVNKRDVEEWLSRRGLSRIDAHAFEAHRLALGVPKGGADIRPDKSFLLESNFDELNGVDHAKGCYIGQETTSRTKRKTRLRKRLLPIDIDGDLPPPGTSVLAGDLEIGTLWSGQGRRAMALVRIDRWRKAVDDGMPLTANGAPTTVRLPEWIEI